MSIDQRIAEIISYMDLGQNQFSEKIGVASATISKIVNGLQQPGAKVILNILHTFPEISCEWLIRGHGAMVIGKKKQEAMANLTQSQYEDLLKDVEKLKKDIGKLKKGN